MISAQGINFHPFCQDVLPGRPLELARLCVGCSFLEQTGLARIINGKTVTPHQQMCSPNVHEFPLPLRNCAVCNMKLLDATLGYIIIVSIVGFILSAWSIFVWLKSRDKTPQIVFKLSLTISDFLFSAVVLPQTAFHLYQTMYLGREEYFAFNKLTDINVDPKSYEKDWEVLFTPSDIRFSAAVLYISQGASLCSLLLLSIDRHIAISYSLKYNKIMTTKKSVFITVGMWLVLIGTGIMVTLKAGTFLVTPSALFLPLVEEDDREQVTALITMYFLPLVVVFLCNVLVTGLTSYELNKSTTLKQSPSLKRKLVPSRKPKLCFCIKLRKYLKGTTSSKSENRETDVTYVAKEGSHDEADAECKEIEDEKKIVDAKASLNVCEPKNGFSCTNLCNPTPHHDVEQNANLTTSVNSAHLSERHSIDLFDTTNNLPDNRSTVERKRNKSSTSRLSEMNTEFRAANITLIVILCVYSACVLPLTILLAVYLFHESSADTIDTVETEDNFKQISTGFTVTVGIFMTSSLWNGVIYSVRNREYRKTSKKLARAIINFFICR